MIDLAIHPLGWVWAVMLAVGVRGARRGDRLTAVAGFGAGLLLTLAGGTPLPDWLLARLERSFVSSARTPPAAADALVMLGGGHVASRFEVSGLDGSQAFDRALTTLHWARAGVSTNVVLGGSRWPEFGDLPSDGEALAGFLRPLVPERCRVVALPPSRTTRDECRHLAALARREGWRRIVLVTSAAHLRRALPLFRSTGLEVAPAACDFTATASLERLGSWSVVPRASTLYTFHTAAHEIVGGWWYAWRKESFEAAGSASR